MICARPQCPGPGLIEDGYCIVCGLAPVSGGGPATSTAATTRLRTTGRSTSTRSTATRARYGAGLVELDAPPRQDPQTMVLEAPCVPEHQRYCVCGHPVGRSRNGSPGRTDGFCPQSGHPFSFTPKLSAGDVVASQYEIAGCLAHGGLGWIYLARDRKVSDRWVVLKGLLNTSDPDALAVALAERRFLAEVEHPNIVKIHNFVEHSNDGYIVMEYVPGVSLRRVLDRRRDDNRGNPAPMPVAEAIVYILEVLPALGHLHDLGLLYCDLKPDNVMQSAHSIKLIDLGAVHRMDDPDTSVYGTVGYQAPEIADTGPTVASDLFTVGRTLAVLATDFTDFRTTHRFTLPPPSEVPLFRQYDSLYRVLLRATAENPDERFRSADEMSDQLLGVLREVVASETGEPASGVSRVFTGELSSATTAPDPACLPALLVHGDDPAAGFLASAPVAAADALLTYLSGAPDQTVEVDLRMARVLIQCNRQTDAEAILASVEAEDPSEWRVAWYRGLAALQRADDVAARSNFNAVYEAVPGELAPRLALAFTAERLTDIAAASRWYDAVCRTDSGYPSAALGLARCLAAAGDRQGAVTALDRVLPTSAAYVDAQLSKARVLFRRHDGVVPEAGQLVQAGQVIDALPLDEAAAERLKTEVLEVALSAVIEGQGVDSAAVVMGSPMTERDLRLALESTYRALARHVPTAAERIALVDRANRVRPRSVT